MIPVTKLVYGEQTFTFVTHDSITIHVAVDRLNAFLEGIKFEPNAVDLPSLYELVITRMAVDEEHVKKITYGDITYPVTLIDMDDGTHILVDGTHRVVKFYRDGLPRILGWAVPSKIWRKFEISGVPGTAEQWNELNQDPKRRFPKDRRIEL